MGSLISPWSLNLNLKFESRGSAPRPSQHDSDPHHPLYRMVKSERVQQVKNMVSSAQTRAQIAIKGSKITEPRKLMGSGIPLMLRRSKIARVQKNGHVSLDWVSSMWTPWVSSMWTPLLPSRNTCGHPCKAAILLVKFPLSVGCREMPTTPKGPVLDVILPSTMTASDLSSLISAAYSVQQTSTRHTPAVSSAVSHCPSEPCCSSCGGVVWLGWRLCDDLALEAYQHQSLVEAL